MSRSNKEGRLSHSGMTIETGHGGLKRNKTEGEKVKPKTKKNKYIEAAANAASSAAKSAGGSEEGATPMDSDTQAWKQIGDAGESIAKQRKANREKAAASKTDDAAVKQNVA